VPSGASDGWPSCRHGVCDRHVGRISKGFESGAARKHGCQPIG
jgi:hypothetical protein